MNKLIFPAIGTVFSLLNANAATIFDASTSNSNVVTNNFNLSSNSFTGTTGALVLTTVAAPNASVPGNTSGNNNASGLASSQDIDTLMGGLGLVSTDTVTMTMTVSSTTGANDLKANGIEFGMSSDGTSFRPAGNLLLQIDADNDNSGMAINGITSLTINAAGWAVTEASLADGFTVTLVADSAGFNFTLTDIQEFGNLTNTTLIFGSTFAGTEFIDNFGGGHLYYARQGSNGTVDVNLSEFSIDVTSAIPEPSTALLSFLGFAGLLRRRRAR
ncbi:PEP-CTERM sorting domain-containing protein [Akkermansiaceae bacterium]|nr:PEP-CTERM sorting domain-containing protein [Akkermansiaceae bacterium]MDB4300493.1 PEP-CTERM sorting domain-containing protein [bacterium]MDB4378047.1 PEP-CTERM sorting domain-containing protein [Akkermansiaceae bacterium]